MTLAVHSPVAGTTIPLGEVPDPVFAQAMVGPGVAVRPEGGRADAVAPIDGTVATLHPHAFVVAADDGRAVLVHLGIDTVKQQGEGFSLHVVQGESVRAGQPVVSWDPDAVTAAGYSPVVPVIALDATDGTLTAPGPGAAVSAGDELFTWSG
ncbi:PTS system N-acetylglucosamine-specific IIA component [Prauserella shujinwangii]|uniref:PTS system N-acetylglucosamine-specific IIA component n=1 Tax=Prauserella shujinwangii TaxID=1453103 RepID=A0A2T0LRH8_9PSEU|nr:PTS glucose transporter subunit IIA [Prauserella shujinwangii]PRX46097.1 PTS system N-acetylglucosamine-specific IIA component [Prauserella shujinwangii]